DLDELLLQAIGRTETRAGDRHAEAAAARPEMRRRRQGVLRHDAYVGELGPEVVGEHLRDDGVLPLPFEREADAYVDLAEDIEAHRRAFRHAGAGLSDDR